MQAKEHWKLECQLLQMKHDKLREQSPLVECTSNSFTEETRAEEIKQVCVFPYLIKMRARTASVASKVEQKVAKFHQKVAKKVAKPENRF